MAQNQLPKPASWSMVRAVRAKTKFMRHLAGLLCLGASLILAPSLRAQNFSIDWHVVAGGGGASTNGAFALSGTIGQPATATMNGGNFSLTGGFWSFLSVVQTPGSPLLTITLVNGNPVISWPTTPGFVLEQSPSGTHATWSNTGGTFTTNAGVTSITISPPTGYQLYRLIAP